MGTIKLCRGDVFVGNPAAIAQGCNIKGAMGAGVALQFKNRFPDMYKEYKTLCERGMLPGGSIFPYDAILNDTRVRVYNLMTQSGFNGADIHFLSDATHAMCSDAVQNGIREITLPFIGVGLGKIEPTVCLNIFLQAVMGYDICLNIVVQYAEGIEPYIILNEMNDPYKPWQKAKETEDLRKQIGAPDIHSEILREASNRASILPK